MVKTTKDRDHAASPAAPGGDVRVTNLYRNQPVVFHFLGGSVRLGPLESASVSRVCLSSPELGHLQSIGAVSVGEPAATSAAPTPKEH